MLKDSYNITLITCESQVKNLAMHTESLPHKYKNIKIHLCNDITSKLEGDL